MKAGGQFLAALVVAALLLCTSTSAQQAASPKRTAPAARAARPAVRPKAPARPVQRARPAPKPRPKVQKPAAKAKPKPGGAKQPKPGSSPAPFVGGEPSAIEARILELTNVERAQAGLGPLTWNNRLGAAAKGHSANMAVTGIFEHVIDGIDAGDRIRAVGYRASSWSENIYLQFLLLSESEGLFLADVAVKGWMNSPGHRANILDPTFTELGVGVVAMVEPSNDSTPGDFPWHLIYATQNFARPSR